jgi:hypothetical protein
MVFSDFKRVKRFFFFRHTWFLVGLTGVLTGCAGAGPEPTPTPTPAPTGRYEPNYHDSLSVGRQWSTINLPYWVAPSEGRNLAGSFDVALATWAPAYDGLFTFTPSTNPDALLQVELVAAGSLGGDTIGVTTVTYRKSDSKIVRAVIRVDSGLGDDLLPQVLSHELGHALGLDGHSAQVEDLMYARAHLPLVLTMRDRNTFSLVYTDLLAQLGRKQQAETNKKDAEGEFVTLSVFAFKKAGLEH